MKFKKRDKVRVVGDFGNYHGKIFIVESLMYGKVDGKTTYVTHNTEYPDNRNRYFWCENELELVKPRFDIAKYVGKYVMHVTTEDQAKIFCRYLDSVGKKWSSGNSYLEYTHFDVYKNRTCYNFNVGDYGTDDIAYCPEYGWTILEFDDFDWSDFEMKKFTKADLKNGDVVKFRDGDIGIVILDKNWIICKEAWANLSTYKDDLLATYNHDVDIVAVRRLHNGGCAFEIFEDGRGELVFERTEVEEMTLEEVCKALGKEIKIVKEK